MNIDLESKLYETYPKIFIEHTKPMSETCMCWGFSCGNGWYKIIELLCYNLQTYIDSKEGKVPQVIATQVKEKFGTLRFYISGGDKFTDGLIMAAENLSGSTCEVCGKQGFLVEIRGWMNTFCKECAKKKKKEFDSD